MTSQRVLPVFFSMDVLSTIKGLAHVRKVEIVIPACRNPELACLNPTMFPVTCIGIVWKCGCVLKIEYEAFKQCWRILYYREVVVCTAFLHQVLRRATLCKQYICRDGSACNRNGIQHWRRNLNFITPCYRQCSNIFGCIIGHYGGQSHS